MDETERNGTRSVFYRTNGLSPARTASRPDSRLLRAQQLPLLRSPVVWLCASVLLLHVIVDASLTRDQAILPSGILLLLENALAAGACIRRARRSRTTAKLLWTLLAAAECIHLASGIQTGLEMVVFHLPHYVTTPSDFLIFMWGAPILLALGSPTESRPARIFYWLDGIQIILMMLMTFVAVFGALPFQHIGTPALSGLESVIVFTTETVVLSLFAGLRLHTHLQDREQRYFFATLLISLGLYSILGPAYNLPNALQAHPLIRLQCILSIHQLALVLFATRPLLWPPRAERTHANRVLALALDNSSPIVFPVLVVLTSVTLLRNQIRLGAAAILCSLFAYATRSTIVQLRYQKVQAGMRDAQRKLQRMSLIDPLTEVPNRRTFDTALQGAWQHYAEVHEPFALMLIDIDHFKLLNDSCGHSEGDRCLRAVAQALQSVLDTEHLLARIGGEEFAAILRRTTATAAVHIANAMRDAVAALGLPNETPIGSTVTVSIGLTDSENAHSAESVFARADQGLYTAKREGRNRTVHLSA